MDTRFRLLTKGVLLLLSCGAGCSAASIGSTPTAETQTRVQIAAASLSDAVVVDCQLPGRLIQLGGTRSYLTPGTLQRLSAVECRSRGGQYTVGDLAGGTFSLHRWLPVAEHGNPEAQYYVARIYANGMDKVPQDFEKAAAWYQRAADQKYHPAMQELGYLYEKGLGVTQDRLHAINLQRQASGLGDDLDYASKLVAVKEESDANSAALSQQLENLNAALADARLQTAQTADRLQAADARIAASRLALVQSRKTVKELQAKLAEAPAGDPAKVKDLETRLAAKQAEVSEKEKALGDSQATVTDLQQHMGEQQAALEANLNKSQTANAQLTELLATKQQDSADLRARLAQSEARLLQSQNELSGLRADYRQAVDSLAAQKALLADATAKKGDGGVALLAAKQAELDQQARVVQELTAQLSAARRQQSVTAGDQATAAANAAAVAAAQKHANASDADNSNLKAEVVRLQGQLAEQQAKLASQRQEVANWSSKSESERDAMARDMTAKLDARSAELDRQQRRIASLEADAVMLRDEVTRSREAREKDMGEADRAREALRMAQAKISDQRDQLDQMKTQFASERAQLQSDRDKLGAALQRSGAEHEQEVASLKADIQEKESILSARAQRIAALEKQMSDRSGLMANNIIYRGPGDAKSPPAPVSVPPAGGLTLPPSSGGEYYALVIGNSNYRYMGSLVTPASDAKSVADLLEQRYGFRVNLMLDATASKIMLALHDYTRTLRDSDRLLVYYAGHGGSQDGPPEAAFWLGVDADPDTREGYLSSEMIRGKIKEMQAKHVLLVADSCFSSAITHPTTTTVGRAMNQKRFDVQWNRRARMVLTSGMDTPVVDSSGDRTHSLFAKYFIQILRQSNDVMSGEMLSHELSVRMHFEAEHLKVSQSPTYSSLNDANHDFGDFFFLPTVTTTVAALR